MANSLMQLVSDGNLSVVPLTIKFFEQSHIGVYIDDVALPTAGYSYAWSGATTITITPAVSAGVQVSIRRQTPADYVLHEFQAGAVFSETSIDDNFRQDLFLLQEAKEQSLVTDLFTDVDMHGNKVRNLGSAVSGGDATPLSQVQQIVSASGGNPFVYAQLFEALRRICAEAGDNLVDGSFEAGGTLVNANDVMLHKATGKVFSGPAGPVSAGTNPASGGFVDRSGELLRQHAVGVDAGTGSALQVITARGSELFTKVSGPALTGDIVIGGVVYRLTTANVESFASLSDTPQDAGCGWPQLVTAEDAKIKSRKAPIQVTSDDVATNGTMKAWRLAEGICDSATAGSFMTGYEYEPQSQVTGFADLDKIGTYQARDSVALFSQVQGQAVTCRGGFTYTATTVTGPEIQAKWDKIKVGMIIDTNLGNTGTYKGAVVTGKVAPYTLQVSPWVDAAGNTVSPPPNGTNSAINQRTHLWGLNSNAIVNNGAVQGIGAEIGMSCLTPGSGTNSKVIYAVNLSGESPEFGFYAKGPFRKGYTVVSVEEFAFYSKGVGANGAHFRAESASGDLEYEYGPTGLKYEAVDYALAYASGQLTTRPITLGVADNLVMSMPPLKAGRRLAYRNFSGTPHTVNGITLASGSYAEFLCDGSSWLKLFTI